MAAEDQQADHEENTSNVSPAPELEGNASEVPPAPESEEKAPDAPPTSESEENVSEVSSVPEPEGNATGEAPQVPEQEENVPNAPPTLESEGSASEAPPVPEPEEDTSEAPSAPEPVEVAPDAPPAAESEENVSEVSSVPEPKENTAEEPSTPESEGSTSEAPPVPEPEVKATEEPPAPESEENASEASPVPEQEKNVPNTPPTLKSEGSASEAPPVTEPEEDTSEAPSVPEPEENAPEASPTPESEVKTPEVPLAPESEESFSEAPTASESEVKAPEVPTTPESQEDVFDVSSDRELVAGNEDYDESMVDSIHAPMTQQAADEGQSGSVPVSNKWLPLIQRALIISMIVIGVVLLCALLKSSLRPVPHTAIASKPVSDERPSAQQMSPKPPVGDDTYTVPQQIPKPENTLSPTQPLSLKEAQNFYLRKDYVKAYVIYDRLQQSLPASTDEELLSDFFQLRKALCMERSAHYDKADHLFKIGSKSHSPVVRILANYYRSLLSVQKKQYLEARIRAYQAIALIGAVDFDRNWSILLQRDCHFLVSEAITKNVLSLCDADKDLPGGLWSSSLDVDPFINLSETQLRSFLNSGTERISKEVLGPRIQKLEQQGVSPCWFVVCHGASIEELLAKFAANAELDIYWALDKMPDSRGTKDTIRKRPVSLYLPAATIQESVITAAGCAGLLALLDEDNVVNIFNPADYSSLSEHISLLSQEAISLLQSFLLMFPDDERIANAHFALGLLQSQKGQVTNAISEYKLVANRFSQTSLAPFALLHSSKLKTGLRDYLGAREDLQQLVEQYPDTEVGGKSYLYLADVSMKAQLYDEAGRLYSKVYYLGLSLESQAASALGAARCFYERKDHQAVAKWLIRYIDIAKDRPSRDLYSAYILLGKADLVLGKTQQACEAFQYALAKQLSREEYVEAVSALVEARVQQENFVEALNILENMDSWQFSQEEFIGILLLKSKILRAIGLFDKAIAILGDRAEYIVEPQLKAKISFELTRCYVAKGDLELAHRDLTKILTFVESGPLAHEVALELADVCLKQGQNPQTISISSQLLDLDPPEQVKQRALALLATAYRRQKNYDRAAYTLLCRWNGAESLNEKTTFGSPADTGQSLQQSK